MVSLRQSMPSPASSSPWGSAARRPRRCCCLHGPCVQFRGHLGLGHHARRARALSLRAAIPIMPGQHRHARHRPGQLPRGNTEARRVAVAHTAFKVVGVAAFPSSRPLCARACPPRSRSRQIANAHSLFNVGMALSSSRSPRCSRAASPGWCRTGISGRSCSARRPPAETVGDASPRPGAGHPGRPFGWPIASPRCSGRAWTPSAPTTLT